MSYLEGVLIQPRELKKHIGKRIEFLTERDIDKSGRGYFFPKRATIKSFYRNNLITEHGDYIPLNTFREVVLLPEDTIN